VPCGIFVPFFTAGSSLYAVFFIFGVIYKEVIWMTLNIIFFTITITKRKTSLEEALHNEKVKEIYEENKSKVAYFTGQ
jgi:uncharacterized protein (TIGR02413 family)